MSARSYRWLATLLELLFADYDRAACVRMLRDEEARVEAAADLGARLGSAGMPAGFLISAAGDNLFVAVLGLRVKFPLDEARQKVALNIAMREGRA